MNIQLQEIKNIFIKNRLTEGVDFKRYEWLVGDGKIQTNTITNTITYFDMYAKLPINDNTDYVVFGELYSENQNSFMAFVRNKRNRDVTFQINANVTHTVILILHNNQTGEVIHWNYTKPIATLEFNNQVKTQNCDIVLGDKPLVLCNRMNSNTSPLTIGRTIINDSTLVPCQLLRSIPTSLDANNIARAAGECGMYDSISGKFYGNVASTGTFTVEGDVTPETHSGLQQIYQNKLIEGEDYETYDWLKADIPTDTADMMILPINSKNFEFKRNWIQTMNSGYFSTSSSTNSYLYYLQNINSTTALKPTVFDINQSSNVYTSSIVVGLGIHTIIANDNGVTISSATNTASLSWYGNPETISFFNSHNNNTHTIHLTSSIKVDGVTRYVPCTLLHSIPRNLDAQCKGRVAGECGMIDLISGKFYGNVASSGTFTVENDNE